MLSAKCEFNDQYLQNNRSLGHIASVNMIKTSGLSVDERAYLYFIHAPFNTEMDMFYLEGDFASYVSAFEGYAR